MALSPGSRLGSYEILAPVGAGGMGEVYRARDARLGRDVAVKVIPSALAGDPERIRRFEQEARAAGALAHANVVAIYDLGIHDGAPFVVMELLEGETLRQRLNQGPIQVRKAVDYAAQAAHGLSAAHAKGIVHRDLKPENLFVTKDGRVKVLDFGLAKLTRPEVLAPSGEASVTIAATETGAILGTVGYMAPEQVRGQATDQRSDLFALGAILYEMLTGRRAFQGASFVETLSAILNEEPAPLSARGREIPPGLEAIVLHCLEKSPEERLQAAQDLAFDLELVSTFSGAVALAPEQSVAASGARRRAMVAAFGLALGTLALGAILGRTVWRAEPPFPSPVRVHRLTEFTGLEEFPALSRDGGSVAFTADVDGKRQLWMRRVAGGPPLQITRDPANHLYPRWSHDSGSIIYFSPPVEGDEAGSLWEISALGGAAHRLARSLSGADLSSIDDRMAFFRLGTSKVELVVGKRDGSELRVMAELEAGYIYGNPRWSPDGRALGYERRYYAGYNEVFVIRAGDTHPTQLAGGLGVLMGFAWLPDNSGIVFSSSRDSIMEYLQTFQLWTLRLDNRRPRQLTFGEASYLHPDLGRSGAVVATRMRMRSDLWRFPVQGDGAENVRRATPVTRQTAEVRTPSVNPNGQEVVYLSDIAGHSNLWVTRLDTGERRQLTFERDPNMRIGVPLWSPDGRQIAFYWSGKSGFGYSTIQPDGSGLRRVLSNGWWACWSPDGRWLYYQDQQGAPAGQLKKVPIDGGSPTTVRTGSPSRPALSPDGKTLYFAVEVPRATGLVVEIRSAIPEDGPSRVLARIPPHRMPEGGYFHPVISPDGQWLALALTDGVTTNIWAVGTADGAMRQLTDFGHRPTFIIRRVSWSPDGRFIYAAVSEGDADIVSVEGLSW